MSGAYEGSQLTYSSALDLVSIPPTECGFNSSEWYSFHPETSVKDQNADIIFNYNASSQHYIQLDSAYLYIKAKVVKQNGENITISDQVKLVENVGAALFNSYDLYFNDTLTSRSNTLYAYRSHLQDLLTTSTSYKAQVLATNKLYIEDKSSSVTSMENGGFKERFRITSTSKLLELVVRPREPIFQSNRLIPPNVSFRLVFRRSSPKFVLVGTDSRSSKTSEPFPYILQIESCVFFMKRHIVLSDIFQHHMSILNRPNGRLKYPVKNLSMKSFIIPPNTTSVLGQVLFSHHIPRTLVLAFPDTDQVVGSLETSPYMLVTNSVE
jgi:hypothetical protein